MERERMKHALKRKTRAMFYLSTAAAAILHASGNLERWGMRTTNIVMVIRRYKHASWSGFPFHDFERRRNQSSSDIFKTHES